MFPIQQRDEYSEKLLQQQEKLKREIILEGQKGWQEANLIRIMTLYPILGYRFIIYWKEDSKNLADIVVGKFDASRELLRKQIGASIDFVRLGYDYDSTVWQLERYYDEETILRFKKLISDLGVIDGIALDGGCRVAG
jgi:hypothetical protein